MQQRAISEDLCVMNGSWPSAYNVYEVQVCITNDLKQTSKSPFFIHRCLSTLQKDLRVRSSAVKVLMDFYQFLGFLSSNNFGPRAAELTHWWLDQTKYFQLMNDDLLI